MRKEYGRMNIQSNENTKEFQIYFQLSFTLIWTDFIKLSNITYTVFKISFRVCHKQIVTKITMSSSDSD